MILFHQPRMQQPMPFRHRHDLLGVFAQHKVACNLLMVIMILAGIWALDRLNTQFFPNIALDVVKVRVEWTGASAEDVEAAITDPLEQQLRSLDGLRQMTSNSAEGSASIILEYEEGTDMGAALDQVKEQVALVRNLPTAAETPEIARVVRYEPVARVLVTSTGGGELRALVQQMERELLNRGIANIQLVGLPEQEIAIQVPAAVLHELDLPPEQILHVGDNLDADVSGAAALGMRTAWITRRVAEPSRTLEAHTGPRPDFVIRDLRELLPLVAASRAGSD